MKEYGLLYSDSTYFEFVMESSYGISIGIGISFNCSQKIVIMFLVIGLHTIFSRAINTIDGTRG